MWERAPEEGKHNFRVTVTNITKEEAESIMDAVRKCRGSLYTSVLSGPGKKIK